MVLLFISIIAILVVLIAYILLTKKYCMFEYIKDGKSYKSKECYSKDQITYCKENNEIIEVDNYYIID